ncbi:hypothetical protein G7Y89_g10603 [Cudoniella acicularis]|uniref:F-box domain-containing protein n=1 Tax=Cudoniella acicularis TaxID=354080 RepID=A0A8H4VZ21_9HELO|nr:hypothetical protein G7Y89_g10603 [Cudoniella acicularis]
MSQQRITLFFPLVSRKKASTKDEKSHFLLLPPHIRLQIYHEAGLISEMTFHMNFWSARKKVNPYRHQAFDHSNESDVPSLPLSLFAVCRLVHEELTENFYGSNRFEITRRAPRGLRALERFSESTLAKIRVLIIRVNLASCVNLCCGYRERKCGNGYGRCSRPSSHDTPLNHASLPDQQIISQWQRICTQLASSILPGKLELYVICDCEDRQTADLIVKPLLTLPILQNFALRLAREHDKDLASLAKETAFRLIGRLPPPPTPPPFKFLHLPQEIQRNILEYTSLVSSGDINCSQNRMLYSGLCSSAGVAAARNNIILHRYFLRHEDVLKCFCTKVHSAFNFLCDQYKCTLEFPFPIFLVSRAFRDMAMEIFYSKNRFSVSMISRVPTNSTNEPEHEQIENGDISDSVSIIRGLSYFPKSASIAFLTRLHLQFEPSPLETLQQASLTGRGTKPNKNNNNNWLHTLTTLSATANLPILTLELRFTEKHYVSVWDFRVEPDASREAKIYDTYEQFIRPVSDLLGAQRKDGGGGGGLKNFFLHLNWGSSCGFPGRGNYDGRHVVEGKLEEMVMGEGYDAWKEGKVVMFNLEMYDC